MLSLARTHTADDQRYGLLVIAGSLVVALITATLVFAYGHDQERQQVHQRGTSTSSMLAQVPFAELVADSGHSLLGTAAFGLGNHFAYVAVTDAAGQVLNQVTAKNVVVPAAPVSSEPAAWYGERSFAADGRELMEFHAPVLEDGSFQGLVRVAYFAPTRSLDGESISRLATFALPVLLLVPFVYLLIRQALRPLKAVQETLSQWADQRLPLAEAGASISGPGNQVVEHLGEFCRLMDERMREVERNRDDLTTSTSIIGYRHRKMHAVLDALPCAVAVLDETGIVTFANARFKPLLGLGAEALVDQRFAEHCPLDEVRTLLYRQRKRNTHASVVCASPVNPEHSVEVSLVPLKASEGLGDGSTVLIASDVTEAEISKRHRSEFVGHVSHELKSPLNVLAMYSEMLLDDAGERREFQVEAANVIHDEVERLSALIGNLLSMTKIETGSLGINPVRVRLQDLLSDVTATMARSAEEHQVTCREELPRDITAAEIDKDLFRIAMNNLVSNAIKYNRPGGEVFVAAEETDDEFVITVRDTGIGISTEDQGQIFDKFYRGGNVDDNGVSGHGLGLALARDIIELHHGALTVDSELGLGSTFTVRLSKANSTALINR